ncbi:MAG: hypothetical protein ACK42G_09015, partial [Candidatus Kapaibacteriota bacterium]
LKLNDFNRIYVRAEDIAGAKSKLLMIPSDTDKKWKVKKPNRKILKVLNFILASVKKILDD